MVQETVHKQKGYPDRNVDMGSSGCAKVDRRHYCGWKTFSKNHEGIYHAKGYSIDRTEYFTQPPAIPSQQGVKR